MEYTLSGIAYRLWSPSAVLLMLGILCVLVSWHKKPKRNMEGVIVGTLTILWGLGLVIYYGNCLINPKIESVTAEFTHEARNSRVAPPLPFTMEYEFNSGKFYEFYLDAFSKKEIFPEDFVEGSQYTVYYEERTQIIVRIDRIS